MHDFFEYFDINSRNGYPISAEINIPEGAKKIVVICHGYGGSMQGRTVLSIAPLLVNKGIGAVSFNWPGHGNSIMSGEWFTVKNCLRDLDSVYEYISEKYPECTIYLMGTSFGGYMALLYNSIYMRSVNKLAVRCCALDMRGIFEEKLIGDQLRHLENYGSIMVDDCDRPFTVTREFYKDLIKYDAITEFAAQRTKYLFVHGSDDEIAPLYDVREFCEDKDLDLEVIDNADHFMSDDNHLAICNNSILKFFLS